VKNRRRKSWSKLVNATNLRSGHASRPRHSHTRTSLDPRRRPSRLQLACLAHSTHVSRARPSRRAPLAPRPAGQHRRIRSIRSTSSRLSEERGRLF
jgi:hypothetical protein